MSKITFKGSIEVFKCGILLFIAYHVFLIREEAVWVGTDDLTVKVVNEYQKPLPVEIRGVTAGIALPVDITDVTTSVTFPVDITDSVMLPVGIAGVTENVIFPVDIADVTTRETLPVEVKNSPIPVKVENTFSIPVEVKNSPIPVEVKNTFPIWVRR